MSPTLHIRSDLTGRILGIIVFLLGIGLLCTVFSVAYKLFGAPPADALGIKITGNAHTDPSLASIGTNFGWVIIRVVCLFIMSIAGSLVSQSGIKLYFSAMKGHTPDVHAPQQSNP